MKLCRLLFCLSVAVAGCAFSLPARASVVGDTITVENVLKVKIETRDTMQRITLSGTKDDPSYYYSQRISLHDSSDVRRSAFNVRDFNKIKEEIKGNNDNRLDLWPYLNLGLCLMANGPEHYSSRLALPACEIGIGVKARWRPFGKHDVWSIGLGYGHRTYSQSADYYWAKDADGKMALAPYEDAQQHRHTRIGVGSLQVPIIYRHNFDEKGKLGISVGGVVNYNFTAYTKQHYELGNDTYDIRSKSIGHRPVTVDAMLIFATPYLPTLYFKYSPTSFFKSGIGAKMHQLSFGIYL